MLPASLRDEIAPTTLIVIGFIMVIIPEPATSTLGAGILLLGIAWWAYEWRRP